MLSSTTRKIVYDITGISTPIATGYEIPFRIFDPDDVEVTITQETGESSAVTTGWSVQVPSSDTGVYKVVFSTGYTFPSEANKLIISRNVPITQEVDLRNGDVFDAEVLEEMFDRIAAIEQELSETLNRTLKLPISESPEGQTLPEATLRSRQVIGYDTDGETLVMYQNPDDAIHEAEDAAIKSEQILQEVTELRNQAAASQAAAEEASTKAESARAESEEIKTSIEQATEEAAASIVVKAEEIKTYLDGYRSAGYAETIGDGASSEFIITHNLHTPDIIPTLTYFSSDTIIPFGRVETIDEGSVKVVFDGPIAENSVRILLSTVKEVAIATLANPITAEDVDDSLAISGDFVNSLFA